MHHLFKNSKDHIVKNKFFAPYFVAFIVIVSICGSYNRTLAQNTNEGQSTLNIKNTFYGHWKNEKDPNQFLDIYKDGSLIIVQRGSNVKDGIERNRLIVTYDKGNRITVDLGYGLSPLTITDDGSRISFLGNEYSKK